ncbi:transporter, small conductance mechanosensitive ion channel MscS family protein [Leptospira kirschneri str. 200803703]|uniref:Transporter, small conductance mechanosensitive ion channel MscS family protein n=1 Tax=Leptospira kirschneri str. 200802841 TaxID=1193047 RepID=A0A828Y9G9_9LEPT|nr:mechanosensitive ion channel domain-containing protein [Leptospira kirschneri]EKO52008.1 transporter, small conductance mechanosensitive ion channel MscS family protein [Leptospira kirschneri str. 200802841]EMN27120.1 transporter, small conductance mechanosensitive ion channel MscS family protein [Leptospira kirschneri serovar Sokoine str. RM1]EMO65374.1 transporter, small conductance mechanosensitive ion channel MscS family protein [Leptospira kirschneri str. 200803703]
MNWNEVQDWFSEDFLWELGKATGVFIFVSFLGYLLSDRISPKLFGVFFGNKILTSHPIYKAGRKIIRLFFFLLSLFLFLKFLKLNSVESVFLSFKILSIVLCTISLSHLFSAILETNTEGMVSSASIIGNAIRIILFTVCILLILQSLGISIVPILGALGVGGLAVALGLQPTLSNLFSGLGILLGKQLKKGDYVRMQGEGLEGYVEDITWRSTTIRKRNDSIIVVPNSVMASSVVTTLELSKKCFSISIEASITYQTDLEKVESLAVNIGNEVLKKFYPSDSLGEISFSYQKFGPSAVGFQMDLPCLEFSDQFLIRHELIKRLHSQFQKEGIEFK